MDTGLIDGYSAHVSDHSIGGHFARQAAATPDHLAIVAPTGTLTFRELELLARKIATGLLPYETRPEEPVAVIMREGTLLCAVMLAVAKLGRIFVPLDSAAPEAWLRSVVEGSDARYIITDETTHAIGLSIARDKETVLNSERFLTFTEHVPVDFNVAPDALLCVLYTSGSAGRPKGVAISHRTMVHRAEVRAHHCRIRAADRIAQLRSSNFAGGMHDMFAALLSGATLYPYDLKKRGLNELSPWLVANCIRGIAISSSILRAWLQTMPIGLRLPDLRVIVAASESLYGADVRRLAHHLQGDWVVVHQLSSTETGTIADCTYGRSSETEDAILPVGQVVEDFEIRLEDESGNPVGPNKAGEIIVRSRYLARGYWKDAVLTAERFGSDPNDPSVGVYRTGDLGRWRGEGLLEFLGRKDRKIKLRGYSIELYEVEQALLHLAGVIDAVALLEEMSGGKGRLVGYVASDRHASAKPLEMRAELFEKLPSHMVPSQIVVLPSLPLTPRGKIDRKALPSPGEIREQTQPVSSAPGNDIERRLTNIWQEALKISNIGMQDDFFVIGGDSLQATQVILEIEREFGVVLPAEVMFSKASTIAGMAVEIEKARTVAAVSSKSEVASPGNIKQQRDVDFAEFQSLPSTNQSPVTFHIDPRTRLRRASGNQRYKRVVFNAEGYRNPELRIPKPAGTTRIAFLGGSTTLDTFVSNDAAWPHVTCESLRSAFPGADIDYVNSGLPGFNSRRLIVLFKEYVSLFDPDAIVIFSSDHNADSAYLARKKGLYHGAHFQPSWLARRSRKWHYLEKNLTILKRLLRARYVNSGLNFSTEQLTADFENRLEHLVRLCQERCRVVMLMTTAGRLRRSQSGFERLRSAVTNVFFMPYMSIDGLLDLYDIFDEAIRRVGMRTGAIVVEPKAAIPGDSAHYVDSSHFRAEGSKCMGAFVAASLAKHPDFRVLIAERQNVMISSLPDPETARNSQRTTAGSIG